MSDTENTTQNTQELPDWAREQLSKANEEAAKYRVEKKDAVEAAKAEVTNSFQSKIDELEAQISAKDGELSNSRHEVDRVKVALEAGIEASKVLSFADLLKGENEDQLRSHADELKKLFTTATEPVKAAATDPSQGSSSSSELPLNGDPLLKAVMSIVNK